MAVQDADREHDRVRTMLGETAAPALDVAGTVGFGDHDLVGDVAHVDLSRGVRGFMLRRPGPLTEQDRVQRRHHGSLAFSASAHSARACSSSTWARRDASSLCRISFNLAVSFASRSRYAAIRASVDG